MENTTLHTKGGFTKSQHAERLREPLEARINRACRSTPKKYVYEALGVNLINHLFNQSGSQSELLTDLEETCEFMAKTLNAHIERLCSDYPKIKIVVKMR